MDIRLTRTGADDWLTYRDVRLAALLDAPDAFGARWSEARTLPEAEWRSRAGAWHPTLLAYDEDRAVGMGGAVAPEDDEHAYLWGMWVAPEVRGRGVAGALLVALLEWCREVGRSPALHVELDNTAARRLYERHGFVVDGEPVPLREGSSRLKVAMRPRTDPPS